VDNEPVGDRKPGIRARILAPAINKNSVPAKYSTYWAFWAVTSITWPSMVFTINSRTPRQRPGGASGRKFLVTRADPNTNTAITIQVLTIVALNSKPSSTAIIVAPGVNSIRRPAL